MVLIYFKDEITGEILTSVNRKFKTVEQANEYLKADLSFPRFDGIETCIEEVEENSLIAFLFDSYLTEIKKRYAVLDDLKETINQEMDDCRLN